MWRLWGVSEVQSSFPLAPSRSLEHPNTFRLMDTVSGWEAFEPRPPWDLQTSQPLIVWKPWKKEEELAQKRRGREGYVEGVLSPFLSKMGHGLLHFSGSLCLSHWLRVSFRGYCYPALSFSSHLSLAFLILLLTLTGSGNIPPAQIASQQLWSQLRGLSLFR